MSCPHEGLTNCDCRLDDCPGISIRSFDAQLRVQLALREIMNELGVPQPGYPTPVANAYEIARRALADLPVRERKDEP